MLASPVDAADPRKWPLIGEALAGRSKKNVTEYPILLHGLAFGILPAHFLSKDGTLHLLGAFGTTKTRRPLGLWQPLFEQSEFGCLTSYGSWSIPISFPVQDFRRLLAGLRVGRSNLKAGLV